MKIGGVHYRTIWRDQTGGVWIIDQTTLPHKFAHASPGNARRCGAGDRHHASARRAADRHYGGLRTLLRAQPRRLRCRAGSGLRDPGRDPSHGGEPQMGAGPDDAGAEAGSACGARRGGLRQGRPARGRGRGDLPADRPSRPEGHRGDRRAQSRPREHPHPLQCGLARLRRLGHRAFADLSGARRGRAGACLGGRDPAAQPGRRADGLRARRAWRAAHRHRRQCGRASDAARPGGPRASWAATG